MDYKIRAQAPASHESQSSKWECLCLLLETMPTMNVLIMLGMIVYF